MLKNIKAGFAVNGLFPFNPDKMLKNIPALSIKPVISRIDKIKIKSYRQNIKMHYQQNEKL